jgi:hypothetical protein
MTPAPGGLIVGPNAHISIGGDGDAAEDDTAQCCGEKRIHVTISFQIWRRNLDDFAPYAGHGRKSYARFASAGKKNRRSRLKPC